MIVAKSPNDMWVVKDAGGKVLAGPFEGSSAAWRWVDRHEGEPINLGEKTAEWIFRKMVDAGT